MNFRDLEIGQSFKFVRGNDDRIHTRAGPGNYVTDDGGTGYLAKRQRDYAVEPFGEPPAPPPRAYSLDELQGIVEGARSTLRATPSLDRDDVLGDILTVLEALVRRS